MRRKLVKHLHPFSFKASTSHLSEALNPNPYEGTTSLRLREAFEA